MAVAEGMGRAGSGVAEGHGGEWSHQERLRQPIKYCASSCLQVTRQVNACVSSQAEALRDGVVVGRG